MFPCALHHYRPELSLERARQLMTLPSVIAVLGLLGIVNQTAPQEARDRFSERVAKVTTEEDRQEFIMRIIARDAGRGPAQA